MARRPLPPALRYNAGLGVMIGAMGTVLILRVVVGYEALAALAACALLIPTGGACVLAVVTPSWRPQLLDDASTATTVVLFVALGVALLAPAGPTIVYQSALLVAWAVTWTAAILTRLGWHRWHTSRLEGLLLALHGLLPAGGAWFDVADVVIPGSWLRPAASASYALFAAGVATHIALRAGVLTARSRRQTQRPVPHLAFFIISSGVALAGIALCFSYPSQALTPTTATLLMTMLVLLTLRLRVTMVEFDALILRSERRHQQFAELVEDAGELVVTTDADLAITYVSPAATHILGQEPCELMGRALPEVLNWSGADAGVAHAIRDRVDDSPPCESTVNGRTLEAKLTRHGEGLLAIVRDITVDAVLRDQLHQLAFNDALTATANRESTVKALEYALMIDPVRAGVLFVDLDGFKETNDTYGHEVGDMVLVEAAERLTRLAADGILVGRFGGDEFVVLVDQYRHNLAALAVEAARTLSEPVRRGETVYPLGASVGHAGGHKDDHAIDLLRRADQKMYANKQRRRTAHAKTTDSWALAGHTIVLVPARACNRHGRARYAMALRDETGKLINPEDNVVPGDAWAMVREYGCAALSGHEDHLTFDAIVDLPAVSDEFTTPGFVRALSQLPRSSGIRTPLGWRFPAAPNYKTAQRR